MTLVRIAVLVAVYLSAASAFSVESNRVFVSTPVSEFPKRLVEDCMTRDPLCLTPDMSVDAAMSALLANRIAGAPVVEDGKLVGIVSSFDFLQKEAFEGALLPMEGSTNQVKLYVDAAQKICGQTVAEVMTRGCKTVTPKTSMREAAEFMTEQNLHRIPVLDSGNLVGILSSADVMRDLLHVARNLPPARDTEELNP